jgi:ABC-type glutathione transport system ATPase component
MTRDRSEEPGADTSTSLLEVERLRVVFGRRGLLGRRIPKTAVDDVSLSLARGETLGIVGESGSGKSTLAKAVARLGPITSGSVRFSGRDITTLTGQDLRRERRHFQMIFQNPATSLNPRMAVVESVMEPLLIHRLSPNARDARARAEELLDRCGLPTASWARRPSGLSGGQQQRVAVARALAVKPQLIIADEPTSALDVSAQARVINLMMSIQQEMNLAFLFISHDLAVVRHVSHRIAVMNTGRIVEEGTADQICDAPKDDYTQRLLAASPSLSPSIERERRRLRAELALRTHEVS